MLMKNLNINMLLIYLIFLLCSCGFFKEKIEEYSRNVYTYETNVASKLVSIIMDMDEDSVEAENLWNLEQSLHLECRYLDEMARKEAFGEEIPEDLGYKMSITVNKCFMKALEINALLKTFE